MVDLLRQYTANYVARHRGQAPPHVQSTLAKLVLCRTAALGGRKYRCPGCDHECVLYNSCGDRNCPQCAGAKRSDWLDSSAQLLLPGIDYFQVVFTIPDRLSSLALGNRRPLYNLLFHSAWQSLREVIAEEQGYEAAALMVLHTWNQKLEPHTHVHAIVPGGGPSLSGKRRWITAERPAAKRRRFHRRKQVRVRPEYLVDADELRLRFRTLFLKGLKRLHRRGELQLSGDWSRLRNPAEFAAWLKPLEEVKWVTYIEPPPVANASPGNVLKYLARYLTGGPIADSRLISYKDGQVTFRARTGQTSGGGDGSSQPYPLSGTEFVRRWSLHVLPSGYTRTRRYGGYHNPHRNGYLTECQALLKAAGLEPATAGPERVPVLPDPDESEPDRNHLCPHCERTMICLQSTRKPSWKLVMAGSHRPAWYTRPAWYARPPNLPRPPVPLRQRLLFRLSCYYEYG